MLFDLWDQHGRSRAGRDGARLHRARSPAVAEACRKSVARRRSSATGRRHYAEWSRCYATEARGLTCDAAARDAQLGDAEAALRDAARRRRTTRLRAARTSRPSSLGHGTSCPVPCASITLFDMSDLADCTVCLADALDGEALEAAYGDRRRRCPTRFRRARRSARPDSRQAAAGLATKLPSGVREVPREGRGSVDCSGAASALAGARRAVARCADSSAVPGCGADAGNARRASASSTRVAEAALGSARVTRP